MTNTSTVNTRTFRLEENMYDTLIRVYLPNTLPQTPTSTLQISTKTLQISTKTLPGI